MLNGATISVLCPAGHSVQFNATCERRFPLREKSTCVISALLRLASGLGLLVPAGAARSARLVFRQTKNVAFVAQPGESAGEIRRSPVQIRSDAQTRIAQLGRANA